MSSFGTWMIRNGRKQDFRSEGGCNGIDPPRQARLAGAVTEWTFAGVRDASNADGFVRINFYGNVRIIKGLNLNGSINNILGAKVYSPPFGSQRDYDAQWTGRTFRAGLTYNF